MATADLEPPLEPILRTRAHTAALAWPLARTVLAVALLAILVAALRDSARPGIVGLFAMLAASVLAAYMLVRLVRRVWEWDRTELALTEREVMIDRRGLGRRLQVVPLAAVERLLIRQGPLGRVLGYGTVELAGRGRRSRLTYVPAPREVGAAIAARAGHAPRDRDAGPPLSSNV